MRPLIIVVGAALINNVVLSQFLGLCAFLGVSKKMDTAAGMGAAVVFVITISSLITGVIYPVSVGAAACGISPDHRIYRSHCSSGAVCGNGH